MIKHESIMLHLIPTAKWGPFDPKGFIESKPVELKPHHFARTWHPETVDDVYTIYVPPYREYEDWEIEKMRAICESFGVRFQLHVPPGIPLC